MRQEPPGDGRYIDAELGVLAGEAAEQAVPTRRAGTEGGPPQEVLDTEAADGDTTYYGRPVLKEPTWVWSVPAYFFTGGAAGAALVLGAAAQATDRRDLATLVSRCRWLGAAGTLAGTGFLIHDLGRRERFLNMLRVFRPSSPMSVGSWVLAGAVPLATAAALLSGADGLAGGLGDAAAVGAGVLGLPLAGYTAVLLSNTAVPVWQGARRNLPVLFVASAVSSAGSLLELTALSEREAGIVRRFSLVGKVASLAAAVAVGREAGQVERVARPLREGPSGALWKAAAGLTAASLLLSTLPGRSRWKRTASGVLGTAGAVALRFAVLQAGRQSARDPLATFQQQRAGLGGAAATGRAAVTGPDRPGLG